MKIIEERWQDDVQYFSNYVQEFDEELLRGLALVCALAEIDERAAAAAIVAMDPNFELVDCGQRTYLRMRGDSVLISPRFYCEGIVIEAGYELPAVHIEEVA